MDVLVFTDPREAAAYWDRFEDRSILPIQPYLWEWPDGRDLGDDMKGVIINRVNRNELDMMVLDPDAAELRVDPALWVHHQSFDTARSVLILTHEQREGSEHPWDLLIIASLPTKLAAENLAKQIMGEAALAFRMVE